MNDVLLEAQQEINIAVIQENRTRNNDGREMLGESR
jgi:hypothetical protein